ncbi:hypothetical protein AB0C21_33085 [Spirillospora sp. NPDC049024]
MANAVAELAAQLYRLTQERIIEWESSGASTSGRFIYSTPSASVVIELITGKSGGRDRVRLSILNSSGDEVDDVEVYRSSAAEPSSALAIGALASLLREDPNAKLVNALYREVRRSVMKADDVIAELLDSLPAEDESGDTEE